MYYKLRFMIEPANGPVCVEISYEEYDLKEQHGGDPDSGNATEPGKNHLRNHRLDLEQQKSTQKNSRDVKEPFYSFPSGTLDILIYTMQFISFYQIPSVKTE